MPETNVNVNDLFDNEPLDAPPQGAAPTEESAPKKEDSGDDVPFGLDKESARLNDAIKEALERSLQYPDLSVVMVDLLNPGLAVTRMQGDFLVHLAPWQHALLAFGLIFAVAVGTNPDLKDKIRVAFDRRRLRPSSNPRPPKEKPPRMTGGSAQ